MTNNIFYKTSFFSLYGRFFLLKRFMSKETLFCLPKGPIIPASVDHAGLVQVATQAELTIEERIEQTEDVLSGPVTGFTV